MISLKHLPHYTYEDYCHWEGQWELIDGIPYAMSPSPFVKHQGVITKILSQLDRQLESNKCNKCKAFPAPMDWIVNNNTVLEPDVMVVCGEIGEKFIEFAPSIIFEILSKSTMEKDRLVKYSIYEREGVKYYIIVDVENDKVQVYELKDKNYTMILEGTDKEITFDSGECKIKFDFKKIWAN